MLRLLYVVLMLCVATTATAEQDFDFHAPASAADPATAAAMKDLAQRALPVYQNDNRDLFLTNLAALQMVAGEYAAADATQHSLAERRAAQKAAPGVDRAVVYALYAQAKAEEARDHTAFERAFAQAFRDEVARLGDRDAFALTRWLETPPSDFQTALQIALDRVRGRSRISLAEALSLVWTYLSFDVFRTIAPLAGPLTAEDDHRRYNIDADLTLMGPKGASLAATVVRPKGASTALPALFQFTIGAYRADDATESAAHGYAGVVAYARVRSRTARGAPYERDGDDARAVINWIAKQPWSDGRVGMYGDAYSGFTAWAAAKHPPAALKALATSSPHAPGVDVPLSADILRTSSEELTGGELAHLRRAANEERLRQRIIPSGRDFARIDLPVLTVSGYFDAALPGALYYFTQLQHYNPKADQAILLGPYDHAAIQYGPWPILRGYTIDSEALIDLRELRYQWFDSVLRKGAASALLRSQVNFEVMGANRWRHAPSLETMSNAGLRLYFDASSAGGRYRLTTHIAAEDAFIEQTVSEAARAAEALPAGPAPILSRTLEAHDAVVLVSEPLPQSLEVSGQFSGELAVSANRRQLEVRLTLYELLASGEYFQLFDPPYEMQAAVRAQRRGKAPPAPGLTFTTDRLTSRKLQAGSRLVMVLTAGSPEGGAEAGGTQGRRGQKEAQALTVRWYGSSFIELPLHK